jgi:hypothetical protein
MLFLAVDLVAFWLMPWSAPFRRACLWFTPDTQPLQGRQPDKDAPKWLRPLFLQRWVGQAVAARLAWLQAHPEADPYRFGHESEPAWVAAAWASYDRRCLRELSEKTLLWIFGMEVERLLRIAQEAPALVGQGVWTKAALYRPALRRTQTPPQSHARPRHPARATAPLRRLNAPDPAIEHAECESPQAPDVILPERTDEGLEEAHRSQQGKRQPLPFPGRRHSMQTAPAPLKRQRWLRWAHPIFWGCVLAGLQILLLTQAQTLAQWSTTVWPVIGIGAFLYLLVPAFAEFLAARQQAKAHSKLSMGCLVGLVSTLIIAIAATVSLVISLNTQPPSPGHGLWNLPPDFFISQTVDFILIECFGAVIGGSVGGWLGGLLARQQAYL